MGKFVAIRNMDDETFRKFRAVAVEEKMKVGDAMTIAMKHWIEEKKKRKNIPDPRNLRKISGMINPGKKVCWSEEIDEILYGMKK